MLELIILMGLIILIICYDEISLYCRAIYQGVMLVVDAVVEIIKADSYVLSEEETELINELLEEYSPEENEALFNREDLLKTYSESLVKTKCQKCKNNNCPKNTKELINSFSISDKTYTFNTLLPVNPIWDKEWEELLDDVICDKEPKLTSWANELREDLAFYLPSVVLERVIARIEEIIEDNK